MHMTDFKHIAIAAAVLAAPAAGQEAAAPAETADEIAARMFATGGSLMDAQLAQRDADAADDAGASEAAAAAVSFFAVPPPEPTLLRPHDLVTVIVREESSSRSAGSTDLQKGYELEAALRDYLDLDFNNLRVGTRAGNQRVSGEAEAAFEGDGRTDRRDSFVTRITAEVLDVKPNGTVVLMATKTIRSDEDEQTIRLTGTCRTADIGADNTVLSTRLHDLSVEKRTRGPVRQATRRGWLPRLIDHVSPF